ncbi:chemotaxis protein CheX [Pseudomonas syringae pv. tomato]|uniref:Chemotaxis protein CheX n=7 Tax=Pseudomonas syringae group TaxID=136849 RepID=A0A2K4X3X7_PSESX|nr:MULTISPECIES: chlorinating enzyme [Pseudomonas syringae group]AAQ93485.1 CmaB [Pseudomonas savastanoi pv. glycinea]AVB17589.1 chlorinating enzyme [Pseudomonas amygdali pv. morsprunorum]AVI87955.1 chemotaxis protein CheX [Pseudomonas syringae pv. tomato]EFW77581.1 coronamic acid synthetase CmaB [Pseudomonas savastanoi pv. glycinea str. B076]EGH04399.1 coronamic acid synthetase CmaB [Pseudomonas amygdali pv. aesculi str. 0893_23]
MEITDFSLTKQELQQFDRDGFIGPFTLYEPEEMKQMHKTIRAQLFNRTHAPYDAPLDVAITNYDRHLDVDLLTSHVFRKEIVHRVRSILGPDVICWRSEFIPKYPGNEGTDWHQADTFAHASGEPQLVWPEGEPFGGAINVWTGFTDASQENGCMQFIPGSHKQMNYDETRGMTFDPVTNNNVVKGQYARGFNGYDYTTLQKDKSWKPDEASAVPIVMKAGQFVIFRSMLMHSSLPNSTTDKTRLGYVARYVPGRVKVYPDTDYVKEFGGEYRLDRFGVVQVAGTTTDPKNKVAIKSLSGMDLKPLVIY